MNLVQKVHDYLSRDRRHYMELLSLIFTLFYFFPYFFFAEFTLAIFLKGLLLYAFLMSNLLACIAVPPRMKIPCAYLLIVFSTIGADMHLGTQVFFGYALFYLTLYQPFWRSLFSLVFTVACVFLAAWAFDLMKAYFLLPCLITCAVLYLSALFERQELKHRKKEELSDQQVERLAAVAERERIARDLHDVLGHTLTSIALKSQLAEKLIANGDTEAASREIRQVAELTSNTLGEVRQAISGYKTMTIDERLIQLRERLHARGLQVEMDCDFSVLKAKAEAAVSLLLTEAVTNILRHSSARKVSIRTGGNSDKFHLRICDDGEIGKIDMGNGLRGIKERVQELDGHFEMLTDGGMCLNIELGGEQLR